MEVKVAIYPNKIIISADGVTKTLKPESDFTTRRLLVGNFIEAEDCLSKGLKEIGASSLFRYFRPILHMYPMEMTEGGLSAVEMRVLRDLGYGAGAKIVEVHI